MSDSLRPHGLYSPWNSPCQKKKWVAFSFSRRIFPTQGSNPDLPHCRWILYHLRYQGSPSLSTAAAAKQFQSCPTLRPHRQPTRLPRPWDSPGKNTRVGCHLLLQCMKVKSESELAQSCPTLSDPMDCNPPGSSVHGIFPARVPEWVAIAFSTYHEQTSQSLNLLFSRMVIIIFYLLVSL